jgi:translation initiation factor IF-3
LRLKLLIIYLRSITIATGNYRDPRDNREPRDKREHRINGEIQVPEVRLVGQEGEPLGIVDVREALRMAAEADVDLVEIAPTAEPPVAKLMDYGKFRYAEQKRLHEAKLKQKVVELKEIKFRPQTDENDYQIKMRNVKKFLEEGDKVKITIRFRGREMAHQEFGMQLVQRVRDEVAEISQVESFPKFEGRQMIMVLAAKKKK